MASSREREDSSSRSSNTITATTETEEHQLNDDENASTSAGTSTSRRPDPPRKRSKMNMNDREMEQEPLESVDYEETDWTREKLMAIKDPVPLGKLLESLNERIKNSRAENLTEDARDILVESRRGVRDRLKELEEAIAITRTIQTQRGKSEEITDIPLDLSRRLAEYNQRGNRLITLDVKTIDCSKLFTCTDDGDGTGTKLKTGDFGNDRLLSLECLDVLRTEPDWEKFFPTYKKKPFHKLYVRDCMQAMFTKLTQDKPPSNSRVLIGSPGVGKSLLFFLAALRQAQKLGLEKTETGSDSDSDKKVIFLRWTTGDRYISVFCMEPCRDSAQPGSVNVFFSREVAKTRDSNLESTFEAIRAKFNLMSIKKWIVFVDGPNYSNTDNTLQGTFDYFCTSGGYPLPKDEASELIEIWILGGWKEKELVDALEVVAGVTHEVAVGLYELCGGRIRLALNHLTHQGEKFAEKRWAALVSNASPQKTTVAIESNEWIEGPSNSDRLRTMFAQGEGELAIQVVDSKYLLGLLGDKIETEPFRKAFNLVSRRSAAVAFIRGGMFEELMHCWFRKAKPRPIKEWVRSSNTGDGGVRELAKAGKNVYWIPSTSNFPNIDAAFLCGETLVCLQYTVKTNHGFNEDSFKAFINLLHHEAQQTFVCTKVKIYFVVPNRTEFTSKHKSFPIPIPVDERASRSRTANQDENTIEVDFHVVQVDVSSNEQIMKTMSEQIPCLATQTSGQANALL